MLSRLLSSRAARSLGAPCPRAIVLDAETLELVTELDAGGRHGDVVAGADGVWLSTPDDRSISHVAPDGTELLRVELPARPTRITLDGDRPVVLCEHDRIVRVEPLEGRIVDDVAGPAWSTGVVAGEGQVWVLTADGVGDAGMHLTLVQLDPVTLAPYPPIDLGTSLYFGDLRIHEGTVSVLHEESPRCMGYATFDVATGAPAPTPDELTRVRGIGERDGVRWITKDREVRRIDVATGREIGSHRLEAPRTGTTILAHGRVWAITYRPPSRADNEDTD